MVHLLRHLLVRSTGGCCTSGFVKHVCCGCSGLLWSSRTNSGYRRLHADGQSDLSKLWFDLDQLESMNRKELQQLCKKLGVKANSKTTTLITDLKEFHKQHISDSSSVLHSPFILLSSARSPVSRKLSEKSALPMSSTLDKNLSLFSPMESPNQWISGEVQKLHKTVKSKGITKRTTGEYKGIAEATRDGGRPECAIYLTKKASVSSILNSTSNKLFMISRWQKQQIELMGKEKFKEYNSELSKCGSMFHSYVKSVLQDKTLETSDVPGAITGLVKSICKADILSELSKDRVLSTEEHVTHKSIGFSGTFDCLAIYKGAPCVIEWKTSQNPRPSLQSCYDAPLQVVAYAGAINSYPGVRIPVTNCLIVIAHHDGSKADVHWMDLEKCEEFWQQWLLKVLRYKERVESNPKASD